jgi:predicted DNA-binding transcriptional regulator AlpA
MRNAFRSHGPVSDYGSGAIHAAISEIVSPLIRRDLLPNPQCITPGAIQKRLSRTKFFNFILDTTPAKPYGFAPPLSSLDAPLGKPCLFADHSYNSFIYQHLTFILQLATLSCNALRDDAHNTWSDYVKCYCRPRETLTQSGGCTGKSAPLQDNIWRLERAGLFPARLKISLNRVAWVEADVDAWLEERRQSHGNNS